MNILGVTATRSQIFAKCGGITDTVSVLLRVLTRNAKNGAAIADIAQTVCLTWKTWGLVLLIRFEVFITLTQAFAKFMNN